MLGQEIIFQTSYFDLKSLCHRDDEKWVVAVRLGPVTGGGFSCGEGADLDEVVGEDAVSAPGSGSDDAGEFGAVPAVAAF
jgi:hypothetical protein